MDRAASEQLSEPICCLRARRPTGQRSSPVKRSASNDVPGDEWFVRETSRFYAPVPVLRHGSGGQYQGRDERPRRPGIHVPTLYERLASNPTRGIGRVRTLTIHARGALKSPRIPRGPAPDRVGKRFEARELRLPMLCSLLCSAHPCAKLAGLAAMARNAKRPIVFEPAAPAALSDRNDVVRLPERRREPTIDFSVAAFGEFGMQSFPTSNICIGGLPVPTGAKIVSFRSLADPVDDA